MNYDLIIIGGGPAGMMAALSARKTYPNYTIAIIDGSFALGRKLLISGAGRGNLTNKNLEKNPEQYYPSSDPKFITSIYSQFSFKEIINFFDDLGVRTYKEKKNELGKIYPTTDQARTVSALLLDELGHSNVNLVLNTKCKKIFTNGSVLKVGTYSKKSKSAREFTARKVILATGGKSYPTFGSDGSGFEIAEKLGHTIIKPIPTAVPIETNYRFPKEAHGLIINAQVALYINGKKEQTETGDILFKKYGISGTSILNLSRKISMNFNRANGKECHVVINFLPDIKEEELLKVLKNRWKKRPSQTVEKSLYGLFPNKLASALLEVSIIDQDIENRKMSDKEIKKLIKQITSTKLSVTGTRGWNEAEFTAGGIDTNEIDSKTLESIKVPNLYFAGEVIDVDGLIGGFNLSWGWSSGHVAGLLN